MTRRSLISFADKQNNGCCSAFTMIDLCEGNVTDAKFNFVTPCFLIDESGPAK